MLRSQESSGSSPAYKQTSKPKFLNFAEGRQYLGGFSLCHCIPQLLRLFGVNRAIVESLLL
jgi:hypothetical protein